MFTKSIAVFCGSRFGKNPKYNEVAERTGRLLAENKFRLVYGHGTAGLMGAVMRGTVGNGGEIYGISEEKVATFEKPSENIAGEISRNMQQRKERFLELSDAYIVLPGGLGTLDELAEVLIENALISRVNDHSGNSYRKYLPIYIVNTDSFYAPLFSYIDHMIREDFMRVSDLDSVFIVKTPDEAIDLIKK